MRHLVRVRLDLFQQFQSFQLGEDGFAREVAIHAFEAMHERRLCETGDGEDLDLGEGDSGLAIEDGGHRQMVALAHGKIVEIMGGGDLDRTGAFFGIGIAIGHDRDFAAGERQDHEASDEIPGALVFGMHRDCGVAQHGFRACGRHGEETARLAIDRIPDMPEMAANLLGLDLKIGNRRLEFRVPVDQPAGAINQVFLIKAHEDRAHRCGKTFIHGENVRAANRARLPGGATGW